MSLFRHGANSNNSLRLEDIKQVNKWLDWYVVYFRKERNREEIYKYYEKQGLQSISFNAYGDVRAYATCRAHLVGHLPWQVGIKKVPTSISAEYLYDTDFNGTDLTKISTIEVRYIEKNEYKNCRNKEYNFPKGVPARVVSLM